MADLDRIGRHQGRSRSALIREAVDRFVAEQQADNGAFKQALDAAFGIWKDRTDIGDSVEWQRRERAGWTRPWDHDYDEVRAEFPDLFDEGDDRERAYWKDIYARRTGPHG